MGLDIHIVWKTSIDPKTGLARAKALPPPVPEEHREFLALHGRVYGQFIPDLNGETGCDASTFLEYGVMTHPYEDLDEEDKEFLTKDWYDRWVKALEWYWDNDFAVEWWF